MSSTAICRTIVAIGAIALFGSMQTEAQADPFVFNGAPDHQTADYGYYYGITGGKFPTGTTPNGDNTSGGTFRRIWDDPYWGAGNLNTWQKDDFFPENAGLALTLYDNGTAIYDNNGIDDGTYGDYYNATAQGVDSADAPGLYRTYNMSNNYDHVYATYFKLEEETTFDTIVAFFDSTAGLDPFSDLLLFSMNIWSSTLVSGDLLPTNTGSFIGDVFSTHTTGGTTTVTDSGIDRVFGVNDGSITDDIFRLEFELDTPITLAAGEYFFSHDAAIVPEPSSLALLVMGGLGLAAYGFGRNRRKRRPEK